MWYRKKRKRTLRRRVTTISKHYQDHKEMAREIISERLIHFSQFYDFTYKRVSIRNQKTCWGSCSEHGNLNFNYRVIFLPKALMDYVIVHELCHLKELNHSKRFWRHVEKAIPDYKDKKLHLRKMTHIPQQGFPSSIFRVRV